VSTEPASGPSESPILAAPGRDAATAAVVAALTAAALVVAADRAALGHIQRVDNSWLQLMVSWRDGPATAIAKVFNVLGLVYVTLPVRIAVAGYLAVRRQWWHCAAFVAAVLLSEILIGPLKGAYDRARPPGSLVATSGASFASRSPGCARESPRSSRAGEQDAARLVARGSPMARSLLRWSSRRPPRRRHVQHIADKPASAGGGR
jgi:undecaprenyl-diphosphatase